MAVVTAQEVVRLTDVSATEAQIEASGKIPIVQERIGAICNNWFTTDLEVESTLTFNATNRTIVGDFTWTTYGFAAGDEIYLYGSYRNDGYYTVLSVSTSTMTLVTGSSVVDELSGASIYVSVVRWPSDVKEAAARMVEYDYSERSKRAGVRSESLGPHSVSYSEGGRLGYPEDIIAPLLAYKVVNMR